MADETPWRTLDLPLPGVPRLLLKSSFTSTGYIVQITDLSRIWGESLTKAAIVQRADERCCCIDPSDESNYSVLSARIKASLNRVDGTNVVLHSPDDENLQLIISAALPAPLPLLEWTVELARLPQPALADQIVEPLLHQAHHLRGQIQSLIDELALKDRVISKITDRLETSGNDLTIVFPGVSKIKRSSAQQKSQRAQAAGHVPGLGDFDETAWRARAALSQVPTDLDAGAVNLSLQDLPAPEGRGLDDNAAKEWWQSLGISVESRSHTPAHSSSKRSARESQEQPADKDQSRANYEAGSPTNESMQADVFQTQSAPPYQRGHTNVSVGARTDAALSIHQADDSTEDEDDLDAVPSQKQASQHIASQHSAAVDSAVPRTSASPQLKSATFGEKKTDSQLPPAKPNSVFGKLGGKTVTPRLDSDPETEDEMARSEPSTTKPVARIGTFGGNRKAASPSPSPEPTANAAKKPKSKLGAFGGKSRVAALATEEPRQEDSSAASPKPHKLGLFGGKRSATTTPEPQRKSRTPEVKQAEVVRETSEERVARRRDELKKLEAVKAPAKKKRKF